MEIKGFIQVVSFQIVASAIPETKTAPRFFEAPFRSSEAPFCFCNVSPRRGKGLKGCFGFAVFADEALEYLGNALGLCAAEL